VKSIAGLLPRAAMFGLRPVPRVVVELAHLWGSGVSFGDGDLCGNQSGVCRISSSRGIGRRPVVWSCSASGRTAGRASTTVHGLWRSRDWATGHPISRDVCGIRVVGLTLPLRQLLWWLVFVQSWEAGLMRWSIQQVARMSGVTARTLRHYDHLGLLRPAWVGAHGYRYYEQGEVLRLQQILLLRELGVDLPTIAAVVGW
jgi:hypothetical protein